MVLLLLIQGVAVVSCTWVFQAPMCGVREKYIRFTDGRKYFLHKKCLLNTPSYRINAQLFDCFAMDLLATNKLTHDVQDHKRVRGRIHDWVAEGPICPQERACL